jgi:hypothetical protein
MPRFSQLDAIVLSLQLSIFHIEEPGKLFDALYPPPSLHSEGTYGESIIC